MKKYKIYFTLYGRKMQAVVEAKDRDTAEYVLRGKIQIDKIEEIRPETGDNSTGMPSMPEGFSEIFDGFFGGKK